MADEPAQRLGVDGYPVAVVPAGAVIYEGPAVLVAASTVPSYNAGMRFFRHVDALGGAFELKIAVASALEVLRRAGRVLRGEPDPTVLDFAARAVTIELVDEPYRYHVGGDVLPPVRSISVRTSRHAMPVLRGAPR